MTDSEHNLIPETAPFRPDEAAWLNRFLPSLTAEQSAWLEGFLTGVRAGRPGGGRPAAAAQTAAPAQAVAAPLSILYGSESGNSEALAFQAAERAKREGFEPRVLSMEDTAPEKLNGAENLLVIVSTWGEGDPPEPAESFYEGFMNDKAPALKGTRFSVCGLGDTAYAEFCKMGKDFDTRLAALGGKRVADRADCDVDYEEPYEQWLERALAGLKEDGAAAAPAAAGAPVAPPFAEPVKYTRNEPYAAELKEKIVLNGERSAKETIHLEFALGASGLSYEPGDSLAVIPENRPEVVDDLIQTCGLDAEEPLSLKEGTFPLREVLTERLDITTLSLTVMKRYAELARNADLDKLIDPSNKTTLQEYLYGRQFIDLLHDFPTKHINADALAGLMRRIPPRLYSIASSLKAHPGEVHLTVAVVRYDAHGRRRQGVCSTYLADRLNVGDQAHVYPARNKNFKLPQDPGVPIIMVGPGTGIAPFRAFIEERAAIGAKGRSWLFFGDQHYLYDFLYQLEWQDHLKKGNLTRLDVAFSRDQPEKIYVQHRMLEYSRDLYAWLQEGAYFYVCGDAARMAVDVDETLHAIVEDEGAMSAEEAAAYVKELKSGKRYLRDVY